MFTKTSEPSHVEKVKELLLTKLETVEPGTPEFTTIVEQYEKLCKASPKKETWLKPELLLPIAGNLAGIIAVLKYEQAHVLTSKAFGLVSKIRV